MGSLWHKFSPSSSLYQVRVHFRIKKWVTERAPARGQGKVKDKVRESSSTACSAASTTAACASSHTLFHATHLAKTLRPWAIPAACVASPCSSPSLIWWPECPCVERFG